MRFKFLLFLLAAFLLTACEQKAEPVPMAGIRTPNGYNVKTLFQHDGCTVYRFYDEYYYRYFVRCKKQAIVQEEHSESCGKACTRRIQTTTVQDDE